VLQQVQSDLLSLLQLVVLPELTPGGVIKEPTLSAVSRIIKGRLRWLCGGYAAAI
jgi:hypothetical protein